MKPLVIHRGTAPDKPLDRWFPPSSECPHWRWGFTEKGWTNNEHTIEWLKEVFIPQSRRGRDPDDASYWRLLIVDGHGSHTQGEFIRKVLNHAPSRWRRGGGKRGQWLPKSGR
jgi:hypothetical protein